MQPLSPAPGDLEEALWFVIEKLGLEDVRLNGYEDSLDYEQTLSLGDASTSLK